MKALYRKHRPKTFADVIGQDEAVTTLTRKHKKDSIPHAILFHGPYGTGKTSLARLTAKALKCSKHDFVEKNSAHYRGIEEVRKIERVMNQSAFDGDVRVWLLDEIHKATNDAQNAMLKMLEDPPNHVYFMLATTEPEKLIKGIRQRCLSIKVNPIEDKQLFKILGKVCEDEEIEIAEDVLKTITKYSAGSAREAIQILDKIRELDEEKQENAIAKTSTTTQTIEIARLLMKENTKWKTLAPILKELRNEDVEPIRRMLLSYATTVMLKTSNPRAYAIIEAFRENFFDSGFAGVISGCCEVING
jgi:DNA polymerase-3 subunit gamma/tau